MKKHRTLSGIMAGHFRNIKKCLIMDVIQKIRKTRGVSIIWIEHKMDAVFNLCDRIVVLDYGKKIAEGTSREIATNRKVVEAYLGEPLA